MMSVELIRELQDEAARNAAEEGLVPLVPWNKGDLFNAPFLGTHVPDGWRAATWDDVPVKAPRGSDWWNGEQACLFVDSTGIADRFEPCLTVSEADEFVTRLLDLDTRTWGVGVVQAGQFQVYLGLYLKEE